MSTKPTAATRRTQARARALTQLEGRLLKLADRFVALDAQQDGARTIAMLGMVRFIRLRPAVSLERSGILEWNDVLVDLELRAAAANRPVGRA